MPGNPFPWGFGCLDPGWAWLPGMNLLFRAEQLPLLLERRQEVSGGWSQAERREGPCLPHVISPDLIHPSLGASYPREDRPRPLDTQHMQALCADAHCRRQQHLIQEGASDWSRTPQHLPKAHEGKLAVASGTLLVTPKLPIHNSCTLLSYSTTHCRRSSDCRPLGQA